MPFLIALRDPLLRVAFLCILLMGPAISSIAPFQSVIGVERLGMGDTSYAVMVTISALFSVAASVAIGIFIDQTQKYRAILLICIGIGIAAGLVMSLWPNLPNFLLVHLLLFPIASTTFTQYFTLAAVAADRNPQMEKDVGLSLVRAGFAGTFAISPPIWSIALARGVDLMAVYWVLAIANVAVFAVVFTMWPKDMNQEAKGSGLTFWEALREVLAPFVMLRLSLITTVTSAIGLFTILLGLLVVNTLGGEEADIGWFAGGIALVELPVMLAGAFLLRRYSRVQVIFAGATIYAVSLFALGLMPSVSAALWLILPFGIGAGIILSVPVGYIQELVAHRPGAGSALISLSHFGGTLVASGVFALGAKTLGYTGVAIIGALLSLCAALLLVMVERHT